MESRDKREKEKSTNKMREMRDRGERVEIKFFFFLQYCYNAILSLELHYNKYCKKFTILAFTIF